MIEVSHLNEKERHNAFNKINTNTTAVCSDGRIKYIIEDKIITIVLKNKVYTNTLISN